MRTRLKIIAVAAGVLLLAGCGNKAVNNPNNNGTKNTQEMAQEQSGGGVISSIKDAMGLGKTMECTYTIKDGMGLGKDVVSKAYVNGKKYKSTNEADGKKMVSLFDEKAIYTWTEGEKTGTKMEQICMEELSKSTEDKTGTQAPLDDKFSKEEAFEDAMDVKCKDASGVDFSVPSGIIFEDQCEKMKNMMKSLEDMSKNIPQGMPEDLPGNVLPSPSL